MELFPIPDTEAACFFCLESPTSNSSENFGNEFPLRNLFHFLGSEAGVKHQPHYSLAFAKICELCAGPLANFQNLFRLWEETEMRLISCLKEIRIKLEVEHSKKFKERGLAVQEITKRLHKKSLAYQPEVVLHETKLPKPEPEGLQIKTEPPEPATEALAHHNNDDQFLPSSEEEASDQQLEPELEEIKDIKYSTGLDAGKELDLSKGIPKRKRGKRVPPNPYRIKPDPSQPGRYLCEVCNLSFKSRMTCRAHYRFKHLNLKPYKCRYCGNSFVVEWSKDRHEFSCKLNPAPQPLPSKCKLCGEEVSGSLRAHQDQVHSNRFKFPCQMCEKRYATRESLRKHRRIAHDRTGRQICKICGLELCETYNLNRHMARVHLNSGKHVCDLCGKKFTSPYELKRHQRVDHLGTKLKCTECLKQYSEKRDLEVHMRKAHPRTKLEQNSCV